VVEDLWIEEPHKVTIKVEHVAYLPFKPITRTVGSPEEECAGREQVVVCELQRGFLVQNIRVVNETGEPKAAVQLVGDLISSTGNPLQVYSFSDEKGLCDITFPPFKEGRIVVPRRPDIAVAVTQEQVSRRKGFTLVVPDEIDPLCTLKGVVQDETGKPVENVMVSRRVQRGKKESSESVVTKEDGLFSLRASRDRIYKLSFFVPLGEGNSRRTRVKEITDVTAGEELKVTLDSKSCTGVQLHMGLLYQGFRERHGSRAEFEYTAWLETEDGQRIEPEEGNYLGSRVIFHGLPEIKVRGRVETTLGDSYSTPYFQVKKGGYINVDVEENK
jgi:hypothetical protein